MLPSTAARAAALRGRDRVGRVHAHTHTAGLCQCAATKGKIPFINLFLKSYAWYSILNTIGESENKSANHHISRKTSTARSRPPLNSALMTGPAPSSFSGLLRPIPGHQSTLRGTHAAPSECQ
jgi:hypothetical protein